MKQKKSVVSLIPYEKREEGFDEWYRDVCYCGGMVDFHPSHGCYVMRDTSMEIWDTLKVFFEREMKRMNVKKCHLPKESSDVRNSLYPYFSKWIRVASDLPLKYNQWFYATRSEMSNPIPFIRSREFLWQEGHSAFATRKEAYLEVNNVVDIYCRIYEELLAIPVLTGRKSEDDSGLFSSTLQVFIPETGRCVQGAYSNCLGQSFAKQFNICFEKAIGVDSLVWQNSWSFSSAAIGLMIMVHGDDKGLVLPPNVAPVQAVIIPLATQGVDQRVRDACAAAAIILELAGIRTQVDSLGDIPLSIKHAHWEQKGIPLRILLGDSEIASNTFLIARRDNGSTISVPRDNLGERVALLLKKVQKSLFKVARSKSSASVQSVETWEEFVDAIESGKLVFAPWCDEQQVERDINERTYGLAKPVCTPYDQPLLPMGTLCFATGRLAKTWTYWSLL
uniref:proline--tRNA ligase n=1 Tax=Noccaea caerulescens TaxID=107243 RepID=A0A1J3DJI3_NOCCA